MRTPEILESSYTPSQILRQVGDLLDRHMPRKPLPKERVLIKPNLLLPAPPDKGILTHPLVVKGAALWVLEHGGDVLVADSPALGTIEKIWRVGGYHETLADLDIKKKAFKAEEKVDVGAPFGTISLSKEALKSELLINLPKFKTHAMMSLTLGVKNLFGCVVGFEKPKWHARAGIEREQFAKLLVKIAEAVAPSVTLVDAVTGLEGQGPGKSGTPVELGHLIAGADVHAVDALCAAMTPLGPENLPTLEAAKALGVIENIPHLEPTHPHHSRFLLPTQSPVTFGPLPLKNIIRRHMVQRPVVNEKACKKCNHCLSYCPVSAISETGQAVAFDLATCIRCYCCVEVCPHAALEAMDPPLGRIIQKAKGALDRLF